MKQNVLFALHHTLEGHTDSINVIAFSPAGNWLASSSEDSSLIIWKPLTGLSLHRIVFPSTILSLAWDPQCARCLFIGCQDGSLAVVVNFEVWKHTHIVDLHITSCKSRKIHKTLVMSSIFN